MSPRRKASGRGPGLLVLGMHRSGTSAATGALSMLGFRLGPVQPPGPDNPKGYFEHEATLRLDERLLDTLGRRWDDPRVLPAGWAGTQAVRALHGEMRSLLQADFAGKEPWVLKDPRLCRLLPAWREVLEAHAEPLLVLLVVRHPDEVAASLATRDQLPAPLGRLLWLRHVLESAEASAGLPRAILSYDALLAKPLEALRDVLGRIGLPLRGPASAGLEAFVDADDRHHRHGQARPSVDAIDAIALDAWARLRCIERGEADWSSLEGLHERLDASLAPVLATFEAMAEARAIARDLQGDDAARWARLGMRQTELLRSLRALERRLAPDLPTQPTRTPTS